MIIQPFSYLTQKLKVGVFYQGGIIVYIDAKSNNGMVAYNGGYTTDALAWGPNGTFTQTAGYGFGYQNTENAYNTLSPGVNTALYTAWNATFNGYDDWFLPNRAELLLVYQARQYFPFWTGGSLWGSEYNVVSTSNAWTQNLDGTQNTVLRSDTGNRRSIACRYITFT